MTAVVTGVSGFTLGAGNGNGTQTFAINGSYFTVNGGTGTINGGGVFYLNGVVFTGPGTLQVTTNGTVSFNGGTFGYCEPQSITFINAGTVNWNSGAILFEAGSVFTNLPGALFDSKFDGSFQWLGPPTETNIFVNLGTFRKSAGSGSTTIVAISGQADFINNGTLSGESGNLNFAAYFGYAIPFTNSTGTIAVSGGSSVQFFAPLVLPGGLITGSGTFIAPSITSVGATVSPGATNAVLNISGSYTQHIGGSMEFDISGTTPGANQSQVNVTGTAKLDGLIGLRLSPGYIPAVNSSNLVLTAASRNGQFRFLDHLFLVGQNKRMTPIYNPASVALTTISATDPTNVSLSVGTSGQTFAVAWPSEFTGYGLYVKTNLTDPTWTLVPGITNRYVENPMTSPQKFFQLIK